MMHLIVFIMFLYEYKTSSKCINDFMNVTEDSHNSTPVGYPCI